MPEQQNQRSLNPPAQEPAAPTQSGTADFGDNSAMQERLATASTPKAAFAAAADSPTSPLPFQTELQARFGAGMSDLRAHLGQQGILQSLGAEAATDGQDLVFASSTPDKETVTEEVAHAMQARVGSSGGSGVSHPNDPAEREAKAVAAGQGDSVGLGMSAGVMRKEANDAGQNYLLADDKLPACAGLSPAQERLVDSFVKGAHLLIQPWQTEKALGNYLFDTSLLRAHYKNFLTVWASERTNTSAQGTSGLLSEVGRRLGAGTFTASAVEIASLNKLSGMEGYLDLLGASRVTVQHHYLMTMDLAVNAGPDIPVVGLGASASAGSYTVHYTNNLGMDWSQSFTMGSLAADIGPGLAPVSLNVEGTDEQQRYSTASANPTRYFSPDSFLWANTAASTISVNTMDGLTQTIGSILFSKDGHDIVFNTSGASRAIGTDSLPHLSVNAETGLTTPMLAGFTPGEVPDLGINPATTSEGDWTPLVTAGVHFSTGSGALLAPAQDTLRELAQATMEVSKANPDSIFRVQVTGVASNVWSAQTDPERSSALNFALAAERADAVAGAIRTELGELEPLFDPTTFEAAELDTFARHSNHPDPNDNSAPERAVKVTVFFNPCPVR